MKRLILLGISILASACSGMPGEPGFDPDELRFTTINGEPAAVFGDPGELNLLYVSRPTGRINGFQNGQWSPVAPSFNQPIPDDPDFEGSLVLPTRLGVGIVFGRDDDDPPDVILGLGQNPCRPDTDGCGGTFGRELSVMLEQIRGGQFTIWHCSTDQETVYSSESACATACPTGTCTEGSF